MDSRVSLNVELMQTSLRCIQTDIKHATRDKTPMPIQLASDLTNVVSGLLNEIADIQRDIASIKHALSKR